MHFEFLHVRAKQNQRCQTGRSNGIALGHGLHGIADGVELVGDVAHLVGQLAHHCNAASVIGDWTERIE